MTTTPVNNAPQAPISKTLHTLGAAAVLTDTIDTYRSLLRNAHCSYRPPSSRTNNALPPYCEIHPERVTLNRNRPKASSPAHKGHILTNSASWNSQLLTQKRIFMNSIITRQDKVFLRSLNTLHHCNQWNAKKQRCQRRGAKTKCSKVMPRRAREGLWRWFQHPSSSHRWDVSGSHGSHKQTQPAKHIPF